MISRIRLSRGEFNDELITRPRYTGLRDSPYDQRRIEHGNRLPNEVYIVSLHGQLLSTPLCGRIVQPPREAR